MIRGDNVSGRIVLVTGGGGFLGSAIVRRLLDRGEQVRSFSRAFYPHLATWGVEQVQGDLGEAEVILSACSNVSAVFHVAAKAGVWGCASDFYNSNVIGTQNVIAACRHQKVARLIYTSSPSAVFHGGDMDGVDESVPYPARYPAAYPRTKALAEQSVLQAAQQGLPAIVLRPHLIWGPGDPHLVPRILSRAKRLRQVGAGENRVDTIYIDNAALAHVLAEARLRDNPALSGRVYFISQDEPLPLWDMINAILKAGGLPPVRRRIAPGLAWGVGALCEAIYGALGIKAEPPMTRFVARELATAHWFDISAAKRDLGYAPEVTTAQGLERLAEWLKTRSLD
jgi:2-alkyl-3-oxoalkanoate reductase